VGRTEAEAEVKASFERLQQSGEVHAQHRV
jgi:hypothetical protein